MNWNLLPDLSDEKLDNVLKKFRKGSGFVFVEYDFEVKKNYDFSLLGIKNIIPNEYGKCVCFKHERVYFYSFNGGSPFLFPVDYFEGMCLYGDGVLLRPLAITYSWHERYQYENDFFIHFEYRKNLLMTIYFKINKSFEIKDDVYLSVDGRPGGYVHFFDLFSKKSKVLIGGYEYLFGWKGLFK